MGNTHLEPETKDKLKAYMRETDCRTASRGVDSLLAEHRELLATRRECELLRRMDETRQIEDVVGMRLLISNIPDDADFGYIIECIHRVTSNEVCITQLPDVGETG